MISSRSGSRGSITISSVPASRWASSVSADITHLVERIGCVGNQLANRDLTALVEGVREEMEKLLDLGLKREFLSFCCSCHCDRRP